MALSPVDEIKVLFDLRFLDGRGHPSGHYYKLIVQVMRLQTQLPESERLYLDEVMSRVRELMREANQPVTIELALFIGCFWAWLSPNRTHGVKLRRTKKGKGDLFHPSKMFGVMSIIGDIEMSLADLYTFSDEEFRAVDEFIQRPLADDLPEPFNRLAACVDYLDGYEHQRERFDLELIERIQKLSSQEVETLVRDTLELIKRTPPDFKRSSLLTMVASFRPQAFPPVQHDLLDARITEPAYLFRTPDRSVSERLAQMLEDNTHRHHLWWLERFVWGQDPYVAEQIQAWLADPPVWWGKELDAPVGKWVDSSYYKQRFDEATLEAGWAFSLAGERRTLFYESAYHLSWNRFSREIPHVNERCGQCGAHLTVVFDLDLTDPRLKFLGLAGTRLRIAGCYHRGTQFCEVDYEGDTRWSAYNELSDTDTPSITDPLEDIHQPDSPSSKLAPAARGCFAAWWFDRTGPFSPFWTSQIGGFPARAFYQHRALYPPCPSCGERMMLVGQIDDDQAGGADAMIYGYLCETCRITAVNNGRKD